MGNSLSILTKCLPQEPAEEGEENDKDASILKQKRELAPKPIEEDEEWGEFEDTFTTTEQSQSQSNREELQKKLKTGPLNSSRDNVLPLSILSKKESSLSNSSLEKNQSKMEDSSLSNSNPSKVSSNEKLEGNEKHNGRLSLTQAHSGIISPNKSNPSEPMSLQKTQAKDIPSPSNKDKMAKSNAPVRSPKMAEEKPQDPTIEPEVDFFSDMTVQYVPPKKAEKHDSNDSMKVIHNSSNENGNNSLPRKISLEREEEEETSSLRKMNFLSDEKEEIDVSEGGWGNDDLGDMEGIDDVDSDREVIKEKEFKSPHVASSESTVDSPRTPRKETKGLSDPLAFGDDSDV